MSQKQYLFFVVAVVLSCLMGSALSQRLLVAGAATAQAAEPKAPTSAPASADAKTQVVDQFQLRSASGRETPVQVVVGLKGRPYVFLTDKTGEIDAVVQIKAVWTVP